MGRKIISYKLNDTYFPTILAQPDPKVFSDRIRKLFQAEPDPDPSYV
jgi:hypothetical protein